MTTRSSLALHGREVSRRSIGPWLLSITRYEAGTSIQSHEHAMPFATVVMRGGYEETGSGRALQCVAGSIVLHPPGEQHADRFARSTVCLNVHGGRPSSAALISSDVARPLAAKLHREFRQPDTVSPQIVEALMLELDALSRRGRADDRAPVWLREIRRQVDAEFAEPLTLASLADAAGIHPSHLARSFRQHYGLTVGEMLRERRIDESKRLLARGCPPADVAALLGFADQSHFTRTFRQSTGTTPAAFRRGLGSE